MRTSRRTRMKRTRTKRTKRTKRRKTRNRTRRRTRRTKRRTRTRKRRTRTRTRKRRTRRRSRRRTRNLANNFIHPRLLIQHMFDVNQDTLNTMSGLVNCSKAATNVSNSGIESFFLRLKIQSIDNQLETS